MQTPLASLSYYQQQQQIAATTAGVTRKLWGRMTDDFSSSWASLATPMLEAVQLGRAAAVASSLGHTSAVLTETGQSAPAFGSLNPERFLATAPNGQSMVDVLDGAVVQAKVAVKAGATSGQALRQAESWLTGVVLTNLADTGRGVVGADIAQRSTLTGYVRMLNAPSCARCVLLAGKWFRWNDGFLRHPRCDCRHIPANEDVGGDMRTDPYEYFKSLSPEAREKTFGRIESRAIDDGADIYRVMNLKARGLGTAKSAKRYGTPTRMTVDDIYRTAGTRTNALKMLESEGYITGPQVRGGNVLGQREGFGQFGKGGKGRAASDAVIESRVLGVRDPLNRYTMTTGERRLFDAKTRLDVGRTGVYPRSIGLNTADKYVKARAITSGELATLERAYANEVAKLATAPASVKRLADLLEPKLAVKAVAVVEAAPAVSIYAAAKTNAEVTQLFTDEMAKRGITVDGFTRNIDVDTARGIAAAVTDMTAKYPNQILKHVTTSNIRANGVLAEARASYSNTDYHPITKQRRIHSGEITFNRKYGNDRTDLSTIWDEALEHEHFRMHGPVHEHVDPAYYATVHEFGHILDFSSQNRLRFEMTDIMKEARKDVKPELWGKWIDENVSGYGQESTAERIAEAFADVEINDAHASPLNKAIHKRLLELVAEESS